jgi:hypothetical protein
MYITEWNLSCNTFQTFYCISSTENLPLCVQTKFQSTSKILLQMPQILREIPIMKLKLLLQITHNHAIQPSWAINCVNAELKTNVLELFSSFSEMLVPTYKSTQRQHQEEHRQVPFC